MKTKQITTSKGDFLLVELPEGVSARYGDTIERTNLLPDLPDGLWLHISRIDGVTEKQASEVVYSCHIDDFQRVYCDYLQGTFMGLSTALQSFNSLLKANGVLFENPLVENPPSITDRKYVFEDHPELVGNPTETDFDLFEKDLEEWQEAQSKVWSKERTYLFKKI